MMLIKAVSDCKLSLKKTLYNKCQSIEVPSLSLQRLFDADIKKRLI